MRPFLVGCLLLITAAIAHAKCAYRSLSYWPADGEAISARPIVLTEGYGGDQDTISGLKGARLIAPGHAVDLKPLARNTSAVSLTQIAWTPTEPLRPGTTYQLEMRGKSKTWRPTRYTADYEKKVPVRWTVAQTPLPIAQWNGPPRLGARSYERLGCGPAVNQQVKLPVTGALAVVDVTLKRGHAEQRYLLPVGANGFVSLGHGMCSGEFVVSGGGTFAAQFALLRSDGSQDAAPAGLSFPAVTAGTKSR